MPCLNAAAALRCAKNVLFDAIQRMTPGTHAAESALHRR